EDGERVGELLDATAQLPTVTGGQLDLCHRRLDIFGHVAKRAARGSPGNRHRSVAVDALDADRAGAIADRRNLTERNDAGVSPGSGRGSAGSVTSTDRHGGQAVDVVALAIS